MNSHDLIILNDVGFKNYVKSRISQIMEISEGWFRGDTPLSKVAYGYIGHYHYSKKYDELLEKFIDALNVLKSEKILVKQYNDNGHFKFYINKE